MTFGYIAARQGGRGGGAYTSDAAAGGTLLGCWFSDIGALNQVAVLRGFEDEAALAAERERTLRSSNPFGCARHLNRMTLEGYAPFPGLPPVEAGAFGSVYEIRTYLLKTGRLVPTFESWAEDLPARTELSKLVIAMRALGGTPRVTHVRPYASTDERAAIRTKSVKRGVWPPKSAVWLTPAMQSTTTCRPPSRP